MRFVGKLFSATSLVSVVEVISTNGPLFDQLISIFIFRRSPDEAPCIDSLITGHCCVIDSMWNEAFKTVLVDGFAKQKWADTGASTLLLLQVKLLSAMIRQHVDKMGVELLKRMSGLLKTAKLKIRSNYGGNIQLIDDLLGSLLEDIRIGDSNYPLKSLS